MKKSKLKKENYFIDHFDNLFDIAHSNVMNIINNDLDKQLLNFHKQKMIVQVH